MSDPQDHDAPHEGPIKTTKQLIWTVVASFVVPIAVIVLLVNYVASGDQAGAGSAAMTEEAIARRIQPVGSIEIRDASSPATLKTGEQVYTTQCAACHASGAAAACLRRQHPSPATLRSIPTRPISIGQPPFQCPGRLRGLSAGQVHTIPT